MCQQDLRTPKKSVLGYDTKLHLMVRLQFRVPSIDQIDLFKNDSYLIAVYVRKKNT